MTNVIIILIIIAVVIYSGKKAKIPGMGGKIWEYISIILLDVAGYIAFLTVMTTGYPEVMDAWMARPGFFFATNAALIICIIVASMSPTKRKWWGAVGVVVLFFVVKNVIIDELEKADLSYPITTTEPITQPPAVVPPEYPSEGEGVATLNSPVKAVLTANTYLYPGGNAIYVDYYDPENYFVDTVINKFGVNKNLWREVLANSNKDRKFLVYPYDKENKRIDSMKSLDFSWSLKRK